MAYDNTEVEIKLKVSPEEAKRTKSLLKSHKAVTSTQLDTYFDTPDRRFSSVEHVEVWLSCRVRHKNRAKS